MDQGNLSSILSGVMSDPDMMNRINGILSDPAAMQTLSGMLSGAGGTDKTQDKDKTDKGVSMPTVTQSSESRNRALLISALKPYLNEDRRDKADKLLGLLTLLDMSGSLGLFKNK